MIVSEVENEKCNAKLMDNGHIIVETECNEIEEYLIKNGYSYSIYFRQFKKHNDTRNREWNKLLLQLGL